MITKVQGISEVICIDDGSTDGSGEIIKKNFPKIKLIKHPTNQGKAAAILTGLKQAENETLLLFDADLRNLKEKEISAALEYFENNHLDCLNLKSRPTNLYYFFLRKISFFCSQVAGNRIVKKGWLIEVFKNKNLQSYQLETAQNQFLIKNKKRFTFMATSMVDINKIDKEDLRIGMIKEIKMWHQIIGYSGWLFVIKQTILFARKKSV